MASEGPSGEIRPVGLAQDPRPRLETLVKRLGIHRLDLGILRRTERRVVQRPAGLPRSVPSVCRRAG